MDHCEDGKQLVTGTEIKEYDCAAHIENARSSSNLETNVNNQSLALSSYFSGEPTQDDPFEAVYQPSASIPRESTTGEQTPAAIPAPVNSLSTDTATLNRLRQRDAWLPSEVTKHALLQPKMERSSALTDIKPVLSTREVAGTGSTIPDANKLNDPYHNLLLSYLRDEATVDALRHVPNPIEQATIGPENLKELITSGWYRVALDVTHRLLDNWGYSSTGNGSPLTPFTAQIWLARFALLVRVRNYELAEKEMNTFGTLDAPNVYFEDSPELYPGRSGSIIPFSLRLVHAELPFHLGRSGEALDRLYHMLAIINRIQTNLRSGFTEDGSILQPDSSYKEASLTIWIRREVRVLSSCLSIYLSELDYQAALDTVHQLAIACSTSPGVVRGLASVMGRIYLQMGDLGTAKVYFERALQDADLKHQPILNIQKLLNQAFLCIGRGEYEEALKLFQQVSDVDPTNVAAANNMAVCSLYLGQLSNAIRVLEKLTTVGLTGSRSDSMSSNRRFCLHDALVFNLAILYEVESEKATTKKLRLLEHLASLPGEPVHVSALKLPGPSN